MLDALTFLNVVFAGATAISPALPMLMDKQLVMPKQQLGAVAEVGFHRHWTASDSDCRYSGVVVSYARDWEEIQGGDMERRLPSEPDKVAGYAVLLDKRVCKDGKPQPVSYIGDAGPSRVIAEGRRVDVHDLTTLPKEQHPRWLLQVGKAVEMHAAKQGNSNPAASTDAVTAGAN